MRIVASVAAHSRVVVHVRDLQFTVEQDLQLAAERRELIAKLRAVGVAVLRQRRDVFTSCRLALCVRLLVVEAAGVAQNGELAERSHLAERVADNSTNASEENWTRSQRIRTAAQLPVTVAIREANAPPIYQDIAARALQLHELKMSFNRIASVLGVDDKTVAKAIDWALRK